MKSILSAIMLLLCISTNAQQVSHAYNPDQGTEIHSKTPGLTELIEKKDDVTGAAIYYHFGNHINNLRGEGLYAIIDKQGNTYDLKLVVYHNVGSAPVYGGSVRKTPEDVTGILIKTSDTLYKFEQQGIIIGNGSTLPHIIIMGNTISKDNYAYKILDRIIKNKYCKIRFESTPAIDDYELSNREIKEIACVVNAWLSVNNIQ